ncbi:hypothetical protein [Nonomuraea sp. NPDC049480]|uniref:hypothetical protein n=1 Tax=Nonomuraea sp. NPDC049480 TaxID=3364353 RepID=UPI0037971C16
MTVQDLRDVLRERAGTPSPANPRRHDQVRARIRRTRLRRRMTAGAAVVAAVAAGVSLIPGATEQPPETTAAAKPMPALPESFASGDGTEYRRLATLTMKANGPEKVSVTVPVSGKPIDVAGLCSGSPGIVTPRVSVNGKHTGFPGFGPCFEKNKMRLHPLVVPKDATEVTVEFDTKTSGWGCTVAKKGGPCVSVKPKRGDWGLAVYEWTPPTEPVDPGPLRDFPGKLGGMKLGDTVSGMWGEDTTFTLVVESTSGKIGLEQLCTGDLAPRMWFTYKVNGKGDPSVKGCAVWEEGPYPMAMSEFAVPKGKRVTITGRVGMWGDHTNRPVRWSTAVYAK